MLRLVCQTVRLRREHWNCPPRPPFIKAPSSHAGPRKGSAANRSPAGVGSWWGASKLRSLLYNWQTFRQRNGPHWAYSQLIVPIVGKKREETHQQRQQKHHHVPAGPQTCCNRGLFLLLFTPWSIGPNCSSTNAVQILLGTTGEIWYNASFLQPLRHFIRFQNVWDEMFVVAAHNGKH